MAEKTVAAETQKQQDRKKIQEQNNVNYFRGSIIQTIRLIWMTIKLISQKHCRILHISSQSRNVWVLELRLSKIKKLSKVAQYRL